MNETLNTIEKVTLSIIFNKEIAEATALLSRAVAQDYKEGVEVFEGQRNRLIVMRRKLGV